MRRSALLVTLAVAAAVLPGVSADKPAPAKPLPPLQAARQRLMRGNYAEAKAAFEKLSADPTTKPAAVVGLATVARETGEYDAAVKVLNDAVAAGSTPDLLAARADLLYDLGRFDEAKADVAAALAKSPDLLSARWTQARILRDTGDVPAADEALRWIVRHYTARSNADKDITDAGELTIVAQAGAENARWHNLSKQFSFILNEVVADALKADPDHWPAEYLAGSMLLEKYNRPDAVEAFDKALAINPKAADALVGKGQAAMLKYDLKEAETVADMALRANPKHPAALRLKADLDLAAEDWPTAEKKLLAARAVNPRDPATLARLAAVYTLGRRSDELKQVIAAAEGFDAKPAQFYAGLADALEDRRRYALAEGYYKKAAELRPVLAAPRTGLGMLQLRLGNEKAGTELLTKAFAADPFNVRVANTLKVMKHLDGYKTVATPHYDLKFDPAKDRVLAEFLAEYLEETHAELKKQFGYEPPGRTLVEVFNSHDMFSGRTVGLPDLGTIGACTGKVFVMASPAAKGVRKPFNWGRVVRHELTHIFNLAQTEYQCPHWLTEGLAVRNERMDRPLSWSTALRDAADTDTLFTLDTVLYGFVRPKRPAEHALAYAQSQLYVEYLTKTHGEAAVGKLLTAYRDGLDTATALKAACGVDKASFEAGYKAHVLAVVKTLAPAAAKKIEKPLTVGELEAANAAEPDDHDVAAQLADALLKRDQPQEARKLVDRVLNADDTHPTANVVKAKLFLRAGDEEAAVVVLERLRKAHPDDAKSLLMLGRLYLQTEEADKAAEVFEHGRKVAPLDGNWLEQLAVVYKQTENNAALLDVLREVVRTDPDELDGLLRLAKVYFEEKKYADALKYAREAMRIDVNSGPAQDVLIDTLKALKQDAEAEKVARRVAEQ